MKKQYLLFLILMYTQILCTGQTREEQNIAHDILLFSLQIEWPDEYTTGEFFTIGVLDKDKRLSGYIEYNLRNKRINGKPVKVSSFLEADNISYCQILIVSRARKRKIDEIFEKNYPRGVLIISDHGKDEDFLMIDYTNAKIREFDIYPENINKADLKMSNDLVLYARKKISLQELYFNSEKKLNEKQSKIEEQASTLTKKIADLDSLSSEIERKNMVLELQEENLRIQSQKIEYEAKRLNLLKGRLHSQQILLLLIILTGILLIGVILLLAYNYKIKKNANKKLTSKNEAITRQKAELEFKSKLITDSINYAKRIQSAILISEEEIRDNLTDVFIFYQPRDIVSGDFYWYSKTKKGHVFASVDCTGHGVSGALMSMIGNTLLNQIVKEKNITRPDKILKALHYGIIESLHQEKKEIYAQDGMDTAVLFVSENKKEAIFSGANQCIYKVQNNMLEKYNGDFITLGGVSKFARTSDSEINFTSHKINLERSMIYLSSDGFTDQFGGPKNKKFNYSNFEEKLIAISNQQPANQKTMLNNTFTQWKGENIQIDDLMVIGLKF